MHIKSIMAAAAIALIAGVGSVSADELFVAATANDPGTPFAMLDGIATSQMSDQEMADTQGAGFVSSVYVSSVYIGPSFRIVGSTIYEGTR